MKKLVQREVYSCDCCGEEFDIETRVIGTQYGYIDGESVVIFEPKVFGDYCKNCINAIQDDWNNLGSNGLCHDRYDVANEKDLKEEIENVKECVKKYYNM